MASERLESVIIGMKRALDAIENCEGDVDFAVFVIKKDIEKLEQDSAEEEE